MQEADRQLITSNECNWNAAMLWGAVYNEALARFTATLQYQGAQIRCFDLPGRGILMVSWKRPDAR